MNRTIFRQSLQSLTAKTMTVTLFSALLTIASGGSAQADVNVNSATVYLGGDGTQGGVSNGLAMTANGTLYLTCNPDGTTMNSICIQPAKADGAAPSRTSYYLSNGTPALGPTSGALALDANEVLFHADPTTKKILRISETNTATVYTQAAAWTGCIGNNPAPRAAAFDSSGNLFIGNDTCGVWVVPSNASGGSTTTTGGTPSQIFTDYNSASATYCERAYALSLDSAGNVYVGCNNGNAISSSVLKLTKSGASYTAARYLNLGINGPTGIAFDSEDLLYVMTPRDFTKYVPVSGTLTAYTSNYRGSFNSTAMTVDQLGNAYVAWDNTVIKFIGVGIPYPPRGLTAVAGNSQVTLSWRNIGLTGIDTFTVTASPGGTTCTTNSGSANRYSCVVSGLTNGTSYSFVVRAANGTGTSLPSSSVSATPAGAPGAPTIGTATAYDSTTATVTFTAPASNGGSAITGYVATAFPGGETGTLLSANSGTIYVYGLATNVAETFTVVAINALGTSLPSAASNSITPLITTTPPAPPAPSIQESAPAPLQRSKYDESRSTCRVVNSERRVEFFGDFVEEITNINIDGVNLSFNSWVKTNLTLKFNLPGATEKKISIQIYNGSVPLLKSQELLCQEVPPSSVATPTPNPTPTLAPTPKPTVNVQPTNTMIKIAAIGFDLNSYFLSTAARSQITKLAEQLNASSAQTVLIYGNTDAQGGVDNVWLSKQRAKAVRVYMSPMLKEKKIRLGWFAATRPAVKGNSKAAYAANRRVEIWVK